MNTPSAPSTFEQLKAILQLPFMVLVIIPLGVHFLTPTNAIIPLNEFHFLFAFAIGSLSLATGFFLFIKSLHLFIKIGLGTLAPWNPTKKMVVRGLYRHVRNPMLIGVNLILLGEAFCAQSGNILIWMFLFISSNHCYFIFKEEPDLVQRFGAEYVEYCQHVPRWIPRIKGWRPEDV